jgi:DNA repair exonuclease SbcCD ATPase subunit
MILFKKIKFKNFGSFGNTWTEIQLDAKNTTLVCGANGSGKSFALLDSITFALFGKPFRKINLTQINNSINKKNCLVELLFTIGKDEYKIVRGLSPKIFEIYKNDKIINQDAKNLDQQEQFEEQILKMNFKTFTQVVILGSSSFIPFMQLSASDRRAVIENILDINIFTTMNVVLKGKISLTKENISDINNKIELQEQKIQYQQKIVDGLAMRLNNDVKKIVDEIKIHEDELSGLQQDIEQLNASKKDYVMDFDISDHRKKSKSISSEISNLTFKMDDLEKEVKFFQKTDKCPKCRTKLTDKIKEENIDKLHEQVNSLEESLKKLMVDETETENLIEHFNQTMKKIDKIDENIKEKLSSIREIKSLVSYKSTQLNESNKIENDLTREKATLKVEKDGLVSLKKEREELKKDFDYLKMAGDILKDNGVKIKIIKHYLPAMNKFINKYLRAMDFFVQFNIDEEFNEVIKSRHRDEFSYMNFSEGEKMRIDLALLLAWREIAKIKNSVNCNLLILDEIFDSSLDSVGTDEVLKLLNALGSKTNVFVISHKADQIIDKFSNTITFEKKNNFSRLTQA